jgi:hypothetical protein
MITTQETKTIPSAANTEMSYGKPISEEEAAALFVLDQVMSYTYQAALRVVALLGVADHLVDGPKTAYELAKCVQADGLRLYSVLRTLATRGIFREIEGGRFELTAPAQFLRTDNPMSLRSAVLMLTDETLWRSAGELIESVRGGSSFKHIYGHPFWEHWTEPGRSSEDFHVGMSSMSETENVFLARSYQFPDHATVVDIAGGFGGLLLRVLRQNPTLHGILFDRANVLARHRLGELGDDSRWELSDGDFFKAVPRGDIYLLKYIAHDWADEQAIQILRCVREAMAPGARVLIMDTVIPDDNAHHFGKVMDLICMAIYPGGRERKKEELRRLLSEADLRMTNVIDTGCYISITEAVAA